MRAALLIPGLDRIGGAERQVILLAEGLRRRGWTVAVVALTGSIRHPVPEWAANGIEFVNLRMRKGIADPRGWLRFACWLRAWRPQVVHAHLPHATWLARWSRLFAPGYALIDTLHSTYTSPRSRHLGYRLSRWLTGRVTAVSESVAHAHSSAGLVPPEALTVLPNGVDTQAFEPSRSLRHSLRNQLGLKNKFVWIAAGRLAPVKDYPTLLRAFRLLPPAAHLLVAGDGPLRMDLEALARELRLEQRVRFLGFVSAIRPFLCASDAAVLSSRWEGLPMALLEAGACALPSVATAVPGSREVLEEGVDGFLAAPTGPVELARKMRQLMDLPAAQRAAMGARARRRTVQRYSLDAVLDRWESLYAEEMGALRPSPGPALHDPAFRVPSRSAF